MNFICCFVGKMILKRTTVIDQNIARFFDQFGGNCLWYFYINHRFVTWTNLLLIPEIHYIRIWFTNFYSILFPFTKKFKIEISTPVTVLLCNFTKKGFRYLQYTWKMVRIRIDYTDDMNKTMWEFLYEWVAFGSAKVVFKYMDKLPNTV